MDNSTRKYKNTADKQTTWFVVFFILAALTISVVAPIIICSFTDYTRFFLYFFIFLVPLLALAIFLALYITSSKVKAKRGYQKLELVLVNYQKEYRLIKDVKVDERHHLDYVLLTPYNIYAINVKNYVGYISGLETEKEWRQSLWNQKRKVALPNPIKECESYIASLKKKVDIEFESVVVLVSGNRGYILSSHLYSPNQFENLIPVGASTKYSEKELEKIYQELNK